MPKNREKKKRFSVIWAYREWVSEIHPVERSIRGHMEKLLSVYAQLGVKEEIYEREFGYGTGKLSVYAQSGVKVRFQRENLGMGQGSYKKYW